MATTYADHSSRIVTPRPEGEDGKFSQSWFPVAMSSEVRTDKALGAHFLGGRIVIFRDKDGQAQALSGYCVHMGASLADTPVVDGAVRCPFHHWRYDGTGSCIATGVGETPPRTAALFRFPTVERYGIVWVFNGEQPLFDLPDLGVPDGELVARTHLEPYVFPIDHWVITANTPDIAHLTFVHELRYEGVNPLDTFEWSENGFSYRVAGVIPDAITNEPSRIDWRFSIRGTSIFVQEGTTDGEYRATVAGFSCPQPGKTQIYISVFAKKSAGERVERLLQAGEAEMSRTTREDAPIFNTMRFRPGFLTPVDAAVARHLRNLAKHPRANPARDYIY